MENHVKFLAQSLACGRCSINGRCLCEEYYCYSSWGDHMWRTTPAVDQTGPLQTEWLLALCKSAFAPAPALPAAAHPKVAPRIGTDPAAYQRALQAPRQRQEWSARGGEHLW